MSSPRLDGFKARRPKLRAAGAARSGGRPPRPDPLRDSVQKRYQTNLHAPARRTQPKLARSASVSGRPMAASTWEGRTLPEEQAEPDGERDALDVERHQQRLRFSARASERPRCWRSRGASGADEITASGQISCDFGLESVAQRGRAARPPRPSLSFATAKAAAKPAMAATFSVPARRPLSCPPPRSSASLIWRPSLGERQGAGARRPPELM